jgi:hypothetical protein
MNTALLKPAWSPVTIALMVAGFIIFWPLGLLMLGYILWGEKFGGSADRAEGWINKQKAWCNGAKGRHGHHFGYQSQSGNAAFDDYRDEQLKRLDEERRRLDEEVNNFHEYMRNLRMARDREEFDRYMREKNATRPFGGDNNQNGNTSQY